MTKRYMDWDGEKVLLKEAKRSLSVLVNEQNTKDAKRGDPGACAITQAICSIAGNDAKVFRNVAYVRRGNAAYRYLLRKSSRDQIVHFDQTGEFPSGPITLEAPSPSSQLDGVKSRTRARRAKKADPKPRKRTVRKSIKMDNVRLGSGKTRQLFTAA